MEVKREPDHLGLVARCDDQAQRISGTVRALTHPGAAQGVGFFILTGGGGGS